ncbi:MAG: hypothetical protein QOF58_3007 [Pseudonocardiales bacterium]|jgi:hypothetical protein|nr:hypothetical protein [Pseudonocardiales bacterium]
MAGLGNVALALMLLGLGTGCGGASAGSSPGDDPQPDDTSMSARTPPTQSRPPAAPSSPSDQFKVVTARGRVEAGAQPGCLELVAYPSRWVLLGAATEGLVEGDEVEVVGLPSPQLRSSCNGMPLKVRDVRKL